MSPKTPVKNDDDDALATLSVSALGALGKDSSIDTPRASIGASLVVDVVVVVCPLCVAVVVGGTAYIVRGKKSPLVVSKYFFSCPMDGFGGFFCKELFN
jgi:hypothetical protein